MGARHSTSISHCDPKNIEDVPNASISPSSVNPNASKPSIPRGPLGDMPMYSRPETFEEKLYRKVGVYDVLTLTSIMFLIVYQPLSNTSF
jgi:hypothetical protein